MHVSHYHVMYDMINALFIRHTNVSDPSNNLLNILRLMGHLRQLRAGVLELAGWASSRSEKSMHVGIAGLVAARAPIIARTT